MNSTLPKVSAAITADLHDVHIRLALSGKFSYWFSIATNKLVRRYPWVHEFFPRWF